MQDDRTVAVGPRESAGQRARLHGEGQALHAIYCHAEMDISRNALASGSREKRQPRANARRLMVRT